MSTYRCWRRWPHRGILEQTDQRIADAGDGQPQRLRHDDEAHRLQPGQPEAETGTPLTAADPFDGTAHGFRQIGTGIAPGFEDCSTAR